MHKPILKKALVPVPFDPGYPLVNPPGELKVKLKVEFPFSTGETKSKILLAMLPSIQVKG